MNRIAVSLLALGSTYTTSEGRRNRHLAVIDLLGDLRQDAAVSLPLIS
jgi:hypothetical protein